MSNSRKHHFVPQFYLKKWCIKGEERLYRTGIVSGKWIRGKQLVKNICCENNLHKIFGSDGSTWCFEENFITPNIDTPFSEIHKKVLDLGVDSLLENDRRIYASYIAALQARNPRTIKQYYEPLFDEEILPPNDIPKHYKESWGEFSKVLKSSHRTKNDFGKLILRAILGQIDSFGQMLMTCSWVQCDFPEDVAPVLTSNYPLVATAGFGNKESMYVFPLSPKSILLMHKDYDFLAEHKKVNLKHLITMLNCIIAGYATEVYYSNKGHEEFVNRYLGVFIPGERRRDAKKTLDDAILFSERYLYQLVEAQSSR